MRLSQITLLALTPNIHRKQFNVEAPSLLPAFLAPTPWVDDRDKSFITLAQLAAIWSNDLMLMLSLSRANAHSLLEHYQNFAMN